MRLRERATRWLIRLLIPRRASIHTPEPVREEMPAARPGRNPVSHVIILDGTMSSLAEGMETNAGRIYKLLNELPVRERGSIYYEAGIQWQSWRQTADVLQGRGLNRQIRRAYGFLASRYRPGDRIYLFGYSRGAYAVRSLAGVIDQVGLLRADAATVRNIRQVYRHYQMQPESEAARVFAAAHCHPGVEIEMVGVWDTVKALGLRLPIIWKLTEPQHAFHNHELGHSVRHGYQALGLHETREAFAPVMWATPPDDWQGHVEQVWFRGAHGDVGGQLLGFEAARPLANIPLVWMLERAEGCGLGLPADWRKRFSCDATAPMLGCWRSWARAFLIRRKRVVGRDPSERIHPTARESAPDLPLAPAVSPP